MTYHYFIKGPFGLILLLLKLKTENWKYYSKIIFKCVNSIVGHINSAWTVCEQYVNSIFCPLYSIFTVHVQEKKKKRQENVELKRKFQLYPNGHIVPHESWNKIFLLVLKLGLMNSGTIFQVQCPSPWPKSCFSPKRKRTPIFLFGPH